MWSALQAVLNGVLLGSLYALIGMGMALIFGVMRIVNFAHGAFLMVGMYVTYVLFDKLGVSPFIGFLGAAVVLFALGVATYQGLLRRIAERSDFMQILLTLGIGLVLSNGAQLVFGADYHQVNFPLLGKNFRLGSHLTFNAPWLVAFAI